MLGSLPEVGPEEWEGLERLCEKEKGCLIGGTAGAKAWRQEEK